MRLSFSKEEQEIVRDLFLLTDKPVIYAANISEQELTTAADENPSVAALREFAAQEGSGVLLICAALEEEIAQLDEEDKKVFLADLGLKESGLDRLIKAGYDLLGLISFLTVGPQEVQFGPSKGTRAPQAAGKIHSDIERGFIRAEIIAYEQLMACGSYAAAEGKRAGAVGREKIT